MRKFIFWKNSIVECEVSIVSPRPDSCKGEEQLYLIESPESLKGERWYSHFFSDSLPYEWLKARSYILAEFNRAKYKKGISYTEQDIEDKLNTVKIERL